ATAATRPFRRNIQTGPNSQSRFRAMICSRFCRTGEAAAQDDPDLSCGPLTFSGLTAFSNEVGNFGLRPRNLVFEHRGYRSPRPGDPRIDKAWVVRSGGTMRG